MKIIFLIFALAFMTTNCAITAQTSKTAALNLDGLKQIAKDTAEVPKTDFTVYAGEYEFMPGRIFIVTAEKGMLYGAANNRKNVLKFLGADRFDAGDNINISFAAFFSTFK